MHFVPTVPYISDLLQSTGTIFKQVGENSLRTFTGLKIGTFSHPKEPPKSWRKNRKRYNFFLTASKGVLAWFEIISQGFILITRTSSIV